jgi:hypothetical protein
VGGLLASTRAKKKGAEISSESDNRFSNKNCFSATWCQSYDFLICCV